MAQLRYIRAQAYGSGDGSGWADAAPISDINNQITLAGAGGKVLLMAGDHFTPMSYPAITAGGVSTARDARVLIAGANSTGSPAPVFFEGTRKYPYDQSDAADTSNSAGLPVGAGHPGNDGLSFKDGANYLALENMVFRNLGNAMLTNSANTTTIDGLALNNIQVLNVRRGFFAQTGKPVSNFYARDFKVKGASKAGMRFNDGTTQSNTNVTIEKFDIDGDWQWGDNFGTGIVSDGSRGAGNHNFVIKDGKVRNFTWRMNDWEGTQSAYWNCDGISSENYDDNFLIKNVEIENISDGGIDCKGTNHIIDNVRARYCKRSYRMWAADGILRDCHSYNPYQWGPAGTTLNVHVIGERTGGVTVIGGTFDNGPDNTNRGMMFDTAAGVVNIMGRARILVAAGQSTTSSHVALGRDVRIESY